MALLSVGVTNRAFYEVNRNEINFVLDLIQIAGEKVPTMALIGLNLQSTLGIV